MALLDTVKKTIRRYQLIGRRDTIVVGVSGGPDSVALLYLLKTLKKEFRLSLYVAHLDHMLRTDSYKDRQFVEALARKLKIPFTAARINIAGLSQRGSEEEIARNARLGFLFRVARDIHATKIALGHTLDDQAETVLMRILRGSGLHGLSGILPRRVIAGFEVIRPLIEVSREEIERFLKKRGLTSRTDTTNRRDIYFRNRVRNRLIPLLEEGYNKRIRAVLSSMAETIGQDYDYLNQQSEAALRRIGRKLSLARFLKLHKALQRIVLRLCIARIKGDLRSITFRHIAEIEDLMLNRPANSIVNLPKGVSVVKKSGFITFYRKKKSR